MTCVQVGSDSTLSDSLRVKALSCIAFLIKLKGKVKSYFSHEVYFSKCVLYCVGGSVCLAWCVLVLLSLFQ